MLCTYEKRCSTWFYFPVIASLSPVQRDIFSLSFFFLWTVFFQPMTFYSVVVKDVFLRITSPCKEQCGFGWGSGCTWSICHRTILLRYQQKDLRSPCLLGVFSLFACLNLLNSPQQHWDCICFSKWNSRTQLFLRSCFFFFPTSATSVVEWSDAEFINLCCCLLRCNPLFSHIYSSTEGCAHWSIMAY